MPGQETVPWIPVDKTASTMVELLLASLSFSKPWLKHYNLVNPRQGKWFSLIPSITKYFSTANEKTTIEPVSFKDWLDSLRATAARTEDVKKNPGIKLLEFYGSMEEEAAEPELETAETAGMSETLKGLSAVGPEWMEIWLRQWNY